MEENQAGRAAHQNRRQHDHKIPVQRRLLRRRHICLVQRSLSKNQTQITTISR